MISSYHTQEGKSNQMDIYLSMKDLAKMLTVNIQWVKRRIKNKEIPYYKIGRRVIIKKSEINEWLKKHRKEK